MRIAIISPVWFAVPPSGYGGIEWIVSLLADGLVDAGHDVTLFASGDSHTKAQLSCVFEQAPNEQIGKSLPDLRHALACFDQAGEFDHRVVAARDGLSHEFVMARIDCSQLI